MTAARYRMGSFSTTIMNRISTTACQCNATLLPGMRPARAGAEDITRPLRWDAWGAAATRAQTGGSEKAARRRAAFSLTPFGNVPFEALHRRRPRGPVL